MQQKRKSKQKKSRETLKIICLNPRDVFLSIDCFYLFVFIIFLVCKKKQTFLLHCIRDNRRFSFVAEEEKKLMQFNCLGGNSIPKQEKKKKNIFISSFSVIISTSFSYNKTYYSLVSSFFFNYITLQKQTNEKKMSISLRLYVFIV